MLSKLGFRLRHSIRPLTQQVKSFSTEESATPSEEELQTKRDEWGFKFDDECFKFEKEWESIATATNKQQREFLEGELSSG